MDTRCLSFYCEGGQTLGEHRYYRPSLKQMILSLVVDGGATPICTGLRSGNKANVTMLLPIVDCLRGRFGSGEVCVVADRGIISAQIITGIEECGLDYILGARERMDALVYKIVPANEEPFVPPDVKRKAGETQLFAKKVKIDGKRYIVCCNEAVAKKEARTARRSSPPWIPDRRRTAARL